MDMFKFLSKYSENFYGETACILRFYLENFISAAVILDFPFSYSVQVSLPYSRVGIAMACYIRSLDCFWTLKGLRS
jgi:hypothetical protein